MTPPPSKCHCKKRNSIVTSVHCARERGGVQVCWMPRSPTLDLCPQPSTLWHLCAFSRLLLLPWSVKGIWSRQGKECVGRAQILYSKPPHPHPKPPHTHSKKETADCNKKWSINWQWSIQRSTLHLPLAKAHFHFSLFESKQIFHTLRTDVFFPFFSRMTFCLGKIGQHIMT